MDLPRPKRHPHKHPCSDPVTCVSSQQGASDVDLASEHKFKYQSIFSPWPSASQEPPCAPREYLPSHSVLELSRSIQSTSGNSPASSNSATLAASSSTSRITITARKRLQGIQDARTNWARSQYRQSTVSKLSREDSGTEATIPFSIEVPPRVTVPPFQLLTTSSSSLSSAPPKDTAAADSKETWCNPHHHIPRLRPLSLIPFTHRSPHDQRELDQVAAQAAAERESSAAEDKEAVEVSPITAEPFDLDTMSCLESSFGTDSTLSTWLADGTGFGRILESKESVAGQSRYPVGRPTTTGCTLQFETVASRPLYPTTASTSASVFHSHEAVYGREAHAPVPLEFQPGNLPLHFIVAKSNESGIVHRTLSTRMAQSEGQSGYGLRELLSNTSGGMGADQSFQVAPPLFRSNAATSSSRTSYTFAFTTSSQPSSSAASQPIMSSSPTPSLDALLRSSQQQLQHLPTLSLSSASRRGLIPPPHNPATIYHLPPHRPGSPSMTDGWPQFQPYPRSAVAQHVPAPVPTSVGQVQHWQHGIPPPAVPAASIMRSALSTSVVAPQSPAPRPDTPSSSRKKKRSSPPTPASASAAASEPKKRRTKRARGSSVDLGIVTEAVPLGSSFLGLGPVTPAAGASQSPDAATAETAKPPVKRRKKATSAAKSGKGDGARGPPRPSV